RSARRPAPAQASDTGCCWGREPASAARPRPGPTTGTSGVGRGPIPRRPPARAPQDRGAAGGGGKTSRAGEPSQASVASRRSVEEWAGGGGVPFGVLTQRGADVPDAPDEWPARGRVTHSAGRPVARTLRPRDAAAVPLSHGIAKRPYPTHADRR